MGDSEKRLVVVRCMVFHSQAHQVSCSSDVMVKIHLVDVGNDAFVARCKLVVALC
jgi:hypothetical protein